MSAHGDTRGAVMLAPLVHTNGTSAESLLDGLLAQRTALRKAIDTLCEYGPNARDYYPQGEHAFAQARREHEQRIEVLRDVNVQLDQILENVCDQRDAIEASKRMR